MRKRSRFVSQGVAVVLVLAGITFVVMHALPNGGCSGCENNAAQSNLRTALTGAQTYYEGSGHTFVGLMNSAASSTSRIREIDADLSYVSRPSTGPLLISWRWRLVPCANGLGSRHEQLLGHPRNPKTSRCSRYR